MKKLLLLYFIFIFLSETTFSQNRYVVRLTDKNNSPYSISNPSAFLSAKSIARRTAHNITYDQSDLPVNPSYISGVAATGVNILTVSKWLNTISIITNDTSLLTVIQGLPYVSGISVIGKHADPGQKHRNKFETPGPVAEINSNALNRMSSFYDYGLAFHQINMLNGDQLHDNGYRGNNMTIAVIDAGFLNVNTLTCFDSLRNSNRLLGTYDFVNFDNDVFSDDSHGAEVLSLMAGYQPGQIIGTAPEASYWLLRSEDANSENIIEEYNWAAAAEFADSVGVDLINTSLGYTTFDDSTQDHTYADMDGNTAPVTIAADMAAAKGILVECSAGNEGSHPWNYISAPADGDSVLTTGAVDSLEFYASFSSNGPSFDGRVKPDVAAQGLGAYVFYPWSGMVGPGSGTSFSGPIMTGMAACLWQAFPSMSNMQIIHAIQQSATQFNNPDTLLGYGIPDFEFAKTLLNIQEFGQNYSADELINIYPDPFINVFNVGFFSNSKQQGLVSIYDVTGRLVYEKKYAFETRSLNRLIISPDIKANGVYFVRVKTQNDSFVKQIIKE